MYNAGCDGHIENNILDACRLRRWPMNASSCGAWRYVGSVNDEIANLPVEDIG
jgi:hypothetical protein